MASPGNPLTLFTTDPGGRALGLRLPPGATMDQTADCVPWPEPLLWISDSPAASGSWSELLPARRWGLQPVLIGPDMGIHEGSELSPQYASRPGDHEAEAVLAGFWRSYGRKEPDTADPESMAGPFGPRWPGLAPPGTLAPGVDPDIVADGLARRLLEPGPDQFGFDGEISRIALVPAPRGADVPASIGWTGPCNHESDTARLSAVLRSWEDRFAIRVVALGGASLHLSVAAPPTTYAAAEVLAAEHLAFSPGVIANAGWWSYRQYAESLPSRTYWDFGWD